MGQTARSRAWPASRRRHAPRPAGRRRAAAGAGPAQPHRQRHQFTRPRRGRCGAGARLRGRRRRACACASGVRHRHRHRPGRPRAGCSPLHPGRRRHRPALRRHRPRPVDLQAPGRADGRHHRRRQPAGHGSVFSFECPSSAGQAEPAASPAPRRPSPAARASPAPTCWWWTTAR